MMIRDGLRPQRNSDSHGLPSDTTTTKTLNDRDVPPTYTIDLSLPPAQRYVQLAADFKPLLASVASIFDDVFHAMYPKMPLPMSVVRLLARKALRSVYSPEETAELRGISEASGVEIYLLIAFNTFLDLLMGCTSGGVRTKSSSGATTMLHFRTLDWGMDSIRQLVVQLDFVESKGNAPFATSLSYAGYVGVLTGVRRGLSMSLNFRPIHNGTSLFERLRFYAFQIMVILGWRPSISSILRHTLLTPTTTSLQSIASGLPSVPSTAAYLIFSDGEQTLVMEKDHLSATLMYRKDFIVATNHDRSDEGPEDDTAPVNLSPVTHGIIGEVDAFREESVARKRCIRLDWQEAVELATGVLPPGQGAPGDADSNFSADQADVVTWLEESPITNECTHYATILDPKEGTVKWLKRYLDPVEPSDGSFTVSSEGSGSE